MLTKRINIFTGYFGSGKTELVINFADHLRRSNPFVVIDDIDVINPYFRTRDVKAFLQTRNIDLVAPPDRLMHSDLPIVSAKIYNYLHDTRYFVLFDVGGDSDGAKALGQYANDLVNLEPEVVFVLNGCRPYVNHVEGIVKTVRNIEKTMRLPVTSIINNTNCGEETTLEMIHFGHELATKAAQELGINYYGTTMWELFSEYKADTMPSCPLFFIKRHMMLDWKS